MKQNNGKSDLVVRKINLFYLAVGLFTVLIIAGLVKLTDFASCTTGYGYGYGLGAACKLGAFILDTLAPSISNPRLDINNNILFDVNDPYQQFEQHEFNPTGVSQGKTTSDASFRPTNRIFINELWIPVGARPTGLASIQFKPFPDAPTIGYGVTVSVVDALTGQTLATRDFGVISGDVVDISTALLSILQSIMSNKQCKENEFHFCVLNFVSSEGRVEVRTGEEFIGRQFTLIYDYASGLNYPETLDFSGINAFLNPRTISTFSDGKSSKEIAFQSELGEDIVNVNIPKDSLVYDLTLLFKKTIIDQPALGSTVTLRSADAFGVVQSGVIQSFTITEPTTIDRLVLYSLSRQSGTGGPLAIALYDGSPFASSNTYMTTSVAPTEVGNTIKNYAIDFSPVTLQPGTYYIRATAGPTADGKWVLSMSGDAIDAYTGGVAYFIQPDVGSVQITKDLSFSLRGSGAPPNLKVDIGNDGTIESGQFDLSSYLSNCFVVDVTEEGKVCQIPIGISADGGAAEVSVSISYQNVPIIYRGCELLTVLGGRDIFEPVGDRNGGASSYLYSDGEVNVVRTCKAIGFDPSTVKGLRVKDRALNTRDVGVQLIIDRTPPVTTATVDPTAPGSGWYNSATTSGFGAQTIAVLLTSVDPIVQGETTTGVKQVNYIVDAGPTQTSLTSVVSFPISGEGIHSVQFYATDNANNAEQTKTLVPAIKIDTRSPITTANNPQTSGSWSNVPVTVTFSSADDTAVTSDVSGFAGTFACVDQTNTCDPFASVTNVVPGSTTVSAEGRNYVRYGSVDVADNKEVVKSTTVQIDYTAPVTTSLTTGTVQGSPFNLEPNLYYLDSATVTLTATDPLPVGVNLQSGVADTQYCVDQTDTCTPSTSGTSVGVTTQGINYVRFNSVDNANNAETVKSIVVRINKDSDGDGVYDNFDACPTTTGPYQGCPVGDKNHVDLHIIDQAKRGDCNGAGSCKFPIEGATVKVFNRNDATFQSLYGGKNPSGTLYPTIYEGSAGWIGANVPLYSLLGYSCKTNAAGDCTAGEAAVGDYLVIVKHVDPETNTKVYSGKPKSPGDFISGVATKEFQIIKTITKTGTIDFKGGSKTQFVGSLLEVVYPDYAIWQNSLEFYPFIFTSDSAWTADVCVMVPEGYKVVSPGECTQVFVAGETKEIVFEVTHVASPEPNVEVSLKAKAPSGKVTEQTLSISGVRVATLEGQVRQIQEQSKVGAVSTTALIAIAIFVVLVVVSIVLLMRREKGEEGTETQ